MRILNRYLVKQHVAPFVFSLAAMTGFMLLNQIARRLPMLLGKGLPWTIIVEFFLLTIPYLVAMTISMSVLVAVLHTFGRLTDDSEITAFRAGGISIGQLVRPVLFSAFVIAFVAFLFGDQVLPRTNHRLRMLMVDIARQKPTFSLKEHVVNEVQRGRVFLRAASIDQATYVMHDVTIYRLTDQNTTRIVYADSGRMAFDLNQEDLQLLLYSGSAHEFDRQDPSLFQRSEYEKYEIRLEGIGREFVRREEDTYRSDRELGTCALEAVARTARQDQALSERRAEAAEQNGLRALLGLEAIEPDTVVPQPRRSLYCSVWDWLRPAELEAQEPAPRQTTTTADSLAANVDRVLTRPARRVHVSGLRPRPRMNEVRVHLDRVHSMKVRAAVNLVELQKKYAIPAACIVFVLVGVPAALRFRGGGLGMVIGVGMVIFGVFYIGLIAGEALANKLYVSAFVAMWAPNILFSVIGIFALWRYGRQGIAARGSKKHFDEPGVQPVETPA
jgi:lipopolysaccharide export system permease protein